MTEMEKYWVRLPDFQSTIVPTLTNVHSMKNSSTSFTVQTTEVFHPGLPITVSWKQGVKIILTFLSIFLLTDKANISVH